MMAHQIDAYLKNDTDLADITNLTRSELLDFAILVTGTPELRAALDLRSDYVDTLRNLKKADLAQNVYTNLVQPIVADKKNQAARKEAARQATIAAEKASGQFETRVIRMLVAINNQIEALQEAVNTATDKIVANPFQNMASYADDLWLASYQLHEMQTLANGIRKQFDEGKMTEAELLDHLRDWHQSQTERCLRSMPSHSTNPLYNVRDFCQHKAACWFAQVLSVVVRYWNREGNIGAFLFTSCYAS